MGNAATIQPSRRPARPIQSPPVSHEPRIQKLADDLAAAGYHPFHAPSAVMLDEANMAVQPLHPLPDLRRISVPRPRQIATPKSSPCARRLQQPNVTLLRNARGAEAGDERRRALRSPASSPRWNGAPERFEADIVVVSCGAANSAALLLRSASDKHPQASPTARARSDATTCFTTARPSLALSLTPNDTMFQKTLALNDFYFGMEGFPYPMGNIQMIGKTLGGMYRAEKPLLTALAPDRASGRDRPPCRRFLADHGRSARAGQSGDASTARGA